MAKAIAAGIPKMRIEEAAARTQARIDSGTQTIVGVNKFQVTDEAEIEVLKVDNKGVRESQIAKLQRLKGERDPAAVAAALAALTEAARAAAATCWSWRWRRPAPRPRSARSRMRMEKVWGRHRAETRAVSGVYTAEAGAMSKDVERVRRMCEAFDEERRPPAAHPGRQDGPGRPRPRPEGDRHARSPIWASTSTSARCLPRPTRRRARRWRTTCTSSACRRWRPGT